ncbi:Ig-like domain-containing protein [Flammeovirga agarivorans]|uniref:PKD domain-containing protein n=1 Tax=Flammeovirga agarivorans TaxID=2726742 RepID=A0A7X8SI20_9BACT|nr:Ig-like domain-containing protein [Flammeovirga agarivorans]NLR90654.1 PKD domain-containing protein [Flammeovirga agarivorans]
MSGSLYAQSVSSFDRIISGPKKTSSAVLAYELHGSGLNPTTSDFTVEKDDGGWTAISNTNIEIFLVQETVNTDYDVYIFLAGEYEDGLDYRVNYSGDGLDEDSEEYEIDITEGDESPVVSNALSPTADLGSSNTDKITSLDRLVFTATATSGETIYIKNGTTTIGSTVATGGVDLIVTTSLAEGDHDIFAYSIDTDGRLSYTSTPIAVTIDLTDPAMPDEPTFLANSTNDTGPLSNDKVTNNTTPTINVDNIDHVSGSQIVITSNIDGEVARVSTSGTDQDITLSALSDGEHELTAHIEDLAGNEGDASDPLTRVIIDTDAPEKPSLSLTTDTGSSDSDLRTRESSPSFSTDAEINSLITLLEGSSNVGTIKSTGTTSITTNTALTSANTYNYTVTATDSAGNVSTASDIVAVDFNNSALSNITSVALDGASDSGLGGDFITNINTPTFNCVFPSAANTLVVTSNLDGNVGGGSISSANQSFMLSTLQEGNHRLTFYLEDVYGNVSGNTTVDLEIDRTAPSVPTLAFDHSSSDLGRNNMDSRTSDNTPTFIVTGDVGSTIRIYVSGSPVGNVFCTGTNSITTSVIANGNTSFTAKAIDDAGNESSSPAAVLVDIKNNTSISAPATFTLKSTSDSGSSNSDKITNNTTPEFELTGVPNGDTPEVIISSNIDGEVARVATSLASLDITLLSALSDNTHTLSAYVEDIYGNQGAVETESITIDTTPPSLSAVSISSDNGISTSLAENNDDVTLSFTSDETLVSPFSATLDGSSIAASVSGLNYSVVKTMSVTGGSSYSPISFSIAAQDIAGNTASAVTSTNDASSVTVFPNLSSTITAPATTNYCDGENTGYTITGTAVGGGSGSYSYDWERSKNSGPYASLTSSGINFTENEVLTSGTYNYRRKVTSEGISGYSNVISITVNDDIANNIVDTPSDDEYCNSVAANAISLTAQTPTGGTGTYSYQWEISLNNGSSWSNAGTSADLTYGSAINTLGTILFRRTVTSSGCTSVSNEIEINIIPSITDNTLTNLSGGATICINEPIVIIGSAPNGGTGGYSYQWQQRIGMGSFTDISGETSQSYYNASVSTSGNYQIRRVVTSGECSHTSSPIMISVPSEPSGYALTPSTTNYSDQTSTAIALSVTGLVSGEGFYCSGPGVITLGEGAGNNSFYPNIAGVGSHTIDYHITYGDCEKVVPVSFTVYDGSTVMNLDQLYCEDESAITLDIPDESSFPGTSPYTLVDFTGPGVAPSGGDYVFTPEDALSMGAADGVTETVTVTANYTDALSVPFSITQDVSITKTHVASINLSDPSFCVTDADVTINANVDGALQTTNGEFQLGSGPVVNNEITISPSSMTPGSHVLTYTYRDVNGCTATDDITIEINELPDVSFRYLDPTDDGNFCFDEGLITLVGEVDDMDVTSGTFSGNPGITNIGNGRATFDPSLAGGELYDEDEDFTITFTYTDGTTNCQNSVDSTVNVFGYDEVFIASNNADSVCFSVEEVIFTPMEGFSQYSGSGSFTIDTGGLTSNPDGTASFDPETAAIAAGETSTGDYSRHILTYTYSNSRGCDLSIKDTIYVRPLPEKPTLVSTIPSYCSDDTDLADIQVTGESGAQFTWYSDSDLTLVSSTSNILEPSDAPSITSDSVVTYYVRQTNVETCTSDTLQVHIMIYAKPLAPSLSIANDTEYCSGETVTALSVASAGQNIKWYTSSALGTPVGLGDTFTPVLNTNVSNDSTVSYYVTETINGCEGPYSVLTIDINKTPDAPTANSVPQVCSGGALPQLSVSTGSDVNWYASADKSGGALVTGTTTYTPSFDTNVVNDSTVSFYATSTSLDGCESDVTQIDVVITALPASPSISAITPYCEGDPLQSITATGEVGATYTWYSDESLDPLYVESTSQVFDPMRDAPSFATYDTLNFWVVQTSGGCTSLATKVDIPVYPTPAKPTVDNINPIYCSGETINAINVTSGSNIRWYNDPSLTTVISSSTSYTPIDPNASNDYTQKYYVTQIQNGCESDTTEITLVINKKPDEPTVIGDMSYCSGETVSALAVTGSVDNDVRWYTADDRVNPVSTALTYTPSISTVVTTEETHLFYVTDSHLGCEGPAREVTIVVHPLPTLSIVGSLTEETTYCKSVGNVGMTGTPAGGNFISPTGAVVNQSGSTFNIDMEDSPLGSHTVRYIYTNDNNCQDSIDYTFNIVDVPEVDFSSQVFCNTQQVEFTDLTTIGDTTTIVSWTYNFGVDGVVVLTDPDQASVYTHDFATPGDKTVTLTVETSQGCTNISTTKNIFIGSPPTVEYEWLVSEFDANMLFTDMSAPAERDTIDSWDWDFGDGNSEIITSASGATDGSTSYRYSSPGVYDVTLTVNTTRGCSRVLTESVYVLPRVFLTSEDDEYIQNFNLDDGDWVPRGDDYSWEYGMATGENLTSTSNAWVTDLTSNYNINEESYLHTPSFDLSGLSRPMMTFDMQLDAETGADGVVLQYSLDSGQTWLVLGAVSDPINWYNSSNIRSNPGNQSSTSEAPDPIGWTGSATEDGGIFNNSLSIRHSLDQFIGEEHLRFRFAFRSNSDLEDEGVMIDNFYIGNRHKSVVIETMTNAGEASINSNMVTLDSLMNPLALDVISINYHVKQDGLSDSLNLDNPEPPSGRTFQYGISDAPTTIVDGNAFLGYTFDFVQNNNHINPIMSRILLDPEFDISIQLPDVGGEDEIEVSVTANKAFSSDEVEIVVHLITVEREINGIETSEGFLTHKDVMKSMSPAPGSEGTSFVGRSWENGSTETFTVAWDNPQVYSTDQAEVIALVQDNISREIYQAIRVSVSDLVSTDPKNVTSISDDLEGWSLYPNPASQSVKVSAPSLLQNCEWILSDINGKKVAEGAFSGNNYSIDLDRFPTGIYVIRHIHDGDKIGNALKLVITK